MLVIILGMHRSGTSLVSSILHTMGVRMGEPSDLERRDDDSQPQGYWEDQDFVALNRQMIRDAGGHWRTPPSPGKVVMAAETYREQMSTLLDRKESAARQETLAAETLGAGPTWIGCGWKDPRTILTVGAWWPHIKDRDLRIVRVWRSIDAIVDSLMARGDRLKLRSPGAGDDEQRVAWAAVANYHWTCTKQFLKITDTLDICGDVRYEDLVRKDTAVIPLNRIATLLGIEGDGYLEAMKRGMDKIVFRG